MPIVFSSDGNHETVIPYTCNLPIYIRPRAVFPLVSDEHLLLFAGSERCFVPTGPALYSSRFSDADASPLLSACATQRVPSSNGVQNLTTKLKDPELPQRLSASVAWGWSTLSNQAGTLWNKATETVAGISDGCVTSYGPYPL